MQKFKEISPYDLKSNPFELINHDWALLSAGTEEKFNCMTVSWGGMGILWNKPVMFTFIRPQRYTMQFALEQEFQSLSFFDENYKDALKFCGSKSGRDYNKPKETGLTTAFADGVPYYEEAKLVVIGKKLYNQFLNEASVVEESVKSNYNNDYHKMFVSEITKILVKE